MWRSSLRMAASTCKRALLNAACWSGSAARSRKLGRRMLVAAAFNKFGFHFQGDLKRGRCHEWSRLRCGLNPHVLNKGFFTQTKSISDLRSLAQCHPMVDHPENLCRDSDESSTICGVDRRNTCNMFGISMGKAVTEAKLASVRSSTRRSPLVLMTKGFSLADSALLFLL